MLAKLQSLWHKGLGEKEAKNIRSPLSTSDTTTNKPKNLNQLVSYDHFTFMVITFIY